MNSAEMAKSCDFVPDAEDLLTEMFEDYKFSFSDSELSSADVFASNGFMPAISFIANSRLQTFYGLSIDANPVESENSITGFTVHPVADRPANMALFLLCAMVVVKEMFGEKPALISLDKLFDWMYSADAQALGLPYLAPKEGD